MRVVGVVEVGRRGKRPFRISRLSKSSGVSEGSRGSGVIIGSRGTL